MKRKAFYFSFLILPLLLLTACGASHKTASTGNGLSAEKRYSLYGIGFYNLENLFDTVHTLAPDGTDKNDYEFTPEGTMKWSTMKYEAKLKNMATVLSQMATDRIPGGATLIGVSEIENRAVLEDLLKQPALRDRGWKIAHVESPDKRGVDCAFFYNPKQFNLETIAYPLYYNEDGSLYYTRGFLTIGGTLAGERVHAIVCHWPSRFSESPARERAGELVRAVKDSIIAEYPGSSVIIMGDLNDDPDDKSLTRGLGA